MNIKKLAPLLLVLALSCNKTETITPKQDKEMALVLDNINYVDGLESQAILNLSTMKDFMTITPPITETAMRTQVDANQAPNAISDAGWQNLMDSLGSTLIDTSLATGPEIAMINTIRQVANPSPQTKCCGTEPPADGLISIAAVARPGSITFEHVVTITLDRTVTCDVNRIDLTLTPFSGAPAVSTAQPTVIGFDRCSTAGGSEWVYVWYEFASDPTGTEYDVEYELYDGQGVLILGITSANRLLMP